MSEEKVGVIHEVGDFSPYSELTKEEKEKYLEAKKKEQKNNH